jgi:hypothetical protein
MLCRSCYREIPPGSLFCPRCGARQGDGTAAGEVPAVAPAAGADADSLRNPWENRARRGAVAAFGETLQESLFRPSAFFRGTDPGGGARAALGYAVLVGTLSLVVALMWQRVLGQHFEYWLQDERVGPLLRQRLQPVLLLALPVGVLLGNLVWAAVLHVSLLVVGGARGGYGTTLKAVCYSSSASAFNVIPVCGAAVGAVWQVVVQVIGVRELHRTSTARAFWAWFLPFVAALCVAGMAAVAMVAGLLNLWHHLSPSFDV